MKQWECMVALKQSNGYNDMPTRMTCAARTYLEAKAYFQNFGRLLNEPRIIQ